MRGEFTIRSELPPADWWQEAAAKQGIGLDKEAAREKIYGMPYSEWKARINPAP